MKEPGGSQSAGRDRSPDKTPDELGQGLAEYALILAFVVVGAVIVVTALGLAIANMPGWSVL